MPISKCATALSKESDGIISPDEADRLIKEIQTRTARKKAAGSAEDIATIMMREAKQMAEEMTAEAVIAKRNALLNREKYLSNKAALDKAKNKLMALKSILGGTSELRTGAGNSIDARQKMYALKFKAGLVTDLEKAGLMPQFNSEEYARLIVRELAELNTPNGKSGITKNAAALQMAQIVKKWQDRAIDLQNRNGAWIRKLPGYVTRTSHDQAKILKAGYKKWSEYIRPKLDEAVTFRNVEAGKEDEFLQSVWEALASGVHFKHGEGAIDINKAFQNSGSIARRVSQERLIHFKSPDDWYDYNVEFGSRNFREGIMNSLDYAAQSIGLMEGLGTNPQGVFDRLRKDALKSLRNAAVTGEKSAEKQMTQIQGKSLDNLFAVVDGTVRRPVNFTVAKISAGIRSVQSMAKLGGSTISSLSDIATLAAELQYNGIDFLGSYAGLVDALLKGRTRIEQEEIGSLVLSGLEGMLGEVHGRWHAEDGMPGQMTKAMYTYFKVNGQNWWNDVIKSYATSALSSNVAMHAPKNFAEAPGELVRSLDRYNIGERDWPVLREMIHTSESGNKYLMPELVHEIEADQLKKLLNEPSMSDYKLKDYRNQLERNLDTYFSDRSDTAVPTPGANEKAIMFQGTQPGTALGEALRFIGQFKSFPVTFLSKIYARETIGRVPGGVSASGMGGVVEGLKYGKGAIGGIAQTIIGTTALGYVAMSIKDYLKGITPRKANDAKTWAAAFVQGGGAGIYGDYLFGEYNRFGRSFLSSLAGPTLGQADDIMELWQRAKKGEDFGANLFRVVKNNTPFINLFYTRAALDYLILYQLQENMNPGFLSRMEDRMKTENDQEFLFPPSEHSTLLGVK